MAIQNRVMAYISTGELTAMYTLRVVTMGSDFHSDRYIKNLSTDADKADRLLCEYCEFAGVANGGNSIGELNAKQPGNKWEVINQHAVSMGLMPWGKYQGERVDSIDTGYLFYMYNQLINETAPHKVALLTLIGSLYGAQFETKIVARQAEKAAQKAAERPVPITDSRLWITGKVLSTKWQESQFGETLKMLALSDNGFKVWGSVPKTLATNESLRGLRVTFMAKVQPRDKDANFGFFSRPSKAQLA